MPFFRPTRRHLMAMLCASLVTLLIAPPVNAQVQPIRVAIANPTRILNDIQETKDLQQKFNTDLQALEVERKERELKIKDARTARDQLKPDSQQWNDRNQELLRLGVEYEVWQQITKADLERRQKQQLRALFDKITDAVAQVATAKGIELVIAEVRPDLPESLDQMQVNELRARLASRNVLFNAPHVDISGDVIAAMDAKYRGSGSVAPGDGR